MRKFKLFLAVAFVLAFAGIAKAENSAQSFDNTSLAQQVFVTAWLKTGATTSDIAKNSVVIIDTTNGTINQAVPNRNSMGSFIATTTTTDSVYVFGVTDEVIATSNGYGRICIRGPHKVVFTSATPGHTGKAVGSSTTAGAAAPVSTASGTSRGTLGVGLSATASTDSGDAANTFWVWVDPARLN